MSTCSLCLIAADLQPTGSLLSYCLDWRDAVQEGILEEPCEPVSKCKMLFEATKVRGITPAGVLTSGSGGCLTVGITLCFLFGSFFVWPCEPLSVAVFQKQSSVTLCNVQAVKFQRNMVVEKKNRGRLSNKTRWETTLQSSLIALITDKIKVPESRCISQLKIMLLVLFF